MMGHKHGRRLIALLLCLTMLPCGAFAASRLAVSYSLGFSMDPQTFPEEERALADVVAPLLNQLTVEGSAWWRPARKGSFEYQFDAMLGGDPLTRNSFDIFGYREQWGIASSLLGDQKVRVNVLALNEFALKTYFHLDIPMQRLTLLVPYTTTIGLKALSKPFRATFDGEGSRVISRADCLAAAEAIAEAAATDSQFRLWTMTVGVEAGVDETLQRCVRNLPDWADSVLAEEGIRIEVTEEGETWTTGDTCLFVKNSEGFTATLPQGSEPFGLSLSWQDKTKYHRRTVHGLLEVNVSGVPVYTARLDAKRLPLRPGKNGDFSIHFVSEGLMPMEVQLAGTQRNGDLTFSWLDNATGAPRVTVSGHVNREHPEEWKRYSGKDDYGFNILSVNDSTIIEFVNLVKKPLLLRGIPLLARIPSETVTAGLDWMEEKGVLAMLTSGSSEEEELFSLGGDTEEFGGAEGEYDGDYDGEYDGEYDSEYDGEYGDYDGEYDTVPEE